MATGKINKFPTYKKKQNSDSKKFSSQTWNVNINI